MELITTSERLQEVFAKCINGYDHLYCCVAWAGNPKGFSVGKLLEKNAHKIEKAVIGLHFYQTHPKFIDTFMDHEGVRFIMETNGIFHDKVYLFANSAKDWSAIVGSSNFTAGGFDRNSECNMIISNDDANSADTYKMLIRHVESKWRNAEYFTEESLYGYERCYDLQKGKRDSLGNIIKTSMNQILSSSLLQMTWDYYCARLDVNSQKDGRLHVLSTVASLFRKYSSFTLMEDYDRQRIGGLVGKESDFALFGTNAKGTLVQQIIYGNKHISKAIDSIPLDGEITRGQYEKFVSNFRKAGWKQPLSAATRLLAMKRPDTFICVNKANIKLLAESLGFAPTMLDLDNYWEWVVEPIRKTSWYKNKPKGVCDKYWDYRVALLDALFYEPKTWEEE